MLNTVHLIETTPKESMYGVLGDLTHSVYPHEDLYGEFCPVHTYIACPPEKLFDYMNSIEGLEEWTYSLRGFRKSDIPDVYVGEDRIGNNTKIFCKVVANKEAMTVDYHCAWDQGVHLWMIYLNRIVPAQLVLNKPGSVLFWQNCKHPFYSQNPFPEVAPKGRPWVGEFWDMFYAGHTIEMHNLRIIMEERYGREC